VTDGPWSDYTPQPSAAAPGPWTDYAPNASVAPIRAVPADAQPGPNGLMWNASGGYDPQTGELVMGGKPMGSASPLVAASTGALGGVPIAGPALLSGAQKAAGAIAGARADMPASQGTADAQDITNASQTAYPKTTLAGNVVGGVAATAPLMAPIGAAADAMGGGILANLGANAGAGAIISGADSAAKGGSVGDVASGAGWGAGFGAAAVPIGAAVGKGAQYVGSKLADALYGVKYGDVLPSQSADALATALGRQGDTGASALQTVQGMGPGATLADSGVASQNLAAALAAQDPKVAPVIQGNLEARADQFSPRMNAAVDAAAGPDVNAVQQMQALKATTAANGAAAYGPILNSGATVDVTPVRNAIANVRVDPIAAGVEEDPISAALGKAQSLFVGSNPSAVPIKVVNQAQDAIDDMASSALRSGDNAKARALWQVRDGLLSQMPPEYNAARAQYASDKAVENAFQNGRSLLAPTVDGQVYDPDLLESRLSTMSPPEMQAFQLGARKSLTDAMGQARTDAAGVKTLLSNDNGYRVQKLQQVIGAPQTNALLGEIDNQATMQATNQKAYQGSQTAMRQAANEDIPTASLMPTGGGGHGFGLLGRIGGGAFGGREIGEMLGHPEIGAGLGAAAGGFGMMKDAVAPFINSSRIASQDASRMALAKALTETPTPALGDALAARAGQASIPGAISDSSKALARAIMLGPAPPAAADGRKYLPFLLSP
jgi:hypothetical protein